MGLRKQNNWKIVSVKISEGAGEGQKQPSEDSVEGYYGKG